MTIEIKSYPMDSSGNVYTSGMLDEDQKEAVTQRFVTCNNVMESGWYSEFLMTML